MKNKLVVAIFFGILVVSISVLGTSRKAPAGEEGKEPIRIGFLAPVTGVFAPLEPFQRGGAELAVAEINAAGGVLGRPLELVIKDTQTLPEVTMREAEDLYLGKEIDIIVGTISDANGVALARWAKSSKVLALLPETFTTAVTEKEGHRHVFRWTAHSRALGRCMALNVARKPWSRIYTIALDYEMGHSVFRDFWAELHKLKPEVQNVGESWAAFTETDFAPIISAALSSQADAVCVLVVPPLSISLLSQAKPFGLFEKMPGFTMELSQDGLIPLGDLLPKGFEGINGCPVWLEDQTMQEFVQNFRKRFNLYPSSLSSNTYITMQFVAKAIEKAKATDIEKVIDALEGLTINTPVGRVTMGKDHQANMPRWWVTYGYSPEWPFAIGVEAVKYQDELYE